jgi:hypothetical protein
MWTGTIAESDFSVLVQFRKSLFPYGISTPERLQVPIH